MKTLNSIKSISKLLLILVILFPAGLLRAQTGTIEGAVSDSAGKPVEAAQVNLQGKHLSAQTDNKGHFLIQNVPAGKYSIAITMVGFETMTEPITVKENKTTKIDFKLPAKVNQLNGVTINGIKEMNGVERLPDNRDGIIYSGQKNVVLVIDSMNSNTAQSSMRQELGRVPGANIAEAQYNGFPYNGIGFRGFDGTQSINMDMRQNGYNITADVYGHPETYYSPPSEAVKEIDVISGESSLEFGPQFGGVVNYVLKDAPTDKPIEFTTSETGGSYGLFNSFNSVGGTLGKWSYYAWAEYQGVQGWRPNSQMQLGVGYAKLQYNANKNFSISVESNIQRNIIHMAGGLSDAEFARNPDTSTRARNWMENPANFAALTMKWRITDKTLFTFQSVFNHSERNLVWRNDDINIGSPDSISPQTNSYAAREVESWIADNLTTEMRFLSHYQIIKSSNYQIEGTFAAGVRLYEGYFNDNDRGPGTTGLDFDMSMPGPGETYGRSVWIHDYNVAPFVQNTFRIGKLSITPGFRYEVLSSTVNGYYSNMDSIQLYQQLGTILDSQKAITGSFTRYIPLGGLALQFNASSNVNIYANFAQCYDPLNYEDLYPNNVAALISPTLHDVHGYNSGLGVRGNINNCLDFDIGGFYVFYQGAIGYDTVQPGNLIEEINVGNATHEGIESYIDWNILKTLYGHNILCPYGYIDIFNAFSYDNAKYVSGPFTGNWVQAAPEFIIRTGLTYTLKNFSATLFWDYTSLQYTDANNTGYPTATSNLGEMAEVGIIPAYHIYDLSLTYRIKNYTVKAGIDNLANASYFTMRVVEYPGPGIIPSVPRTGYVGFSTTF